MTAALDLAKAALVSASVGVGEGGGDVVLEEADVAVDLFEGDFGVDLWGVLEVLAGFEKTCGICFSRSTAARRRVSAEA